MNSIEVQVKFFNEDNGGRKTLPNLSCGTYRPHFVVTGRPEDEYLGIQFVSQNDDLLPNKEVVATVQLVYSGVNYSPLKKGVTFKIMEGGKNVGVGSVL